MNTLNRILICCLTLLVSCNLAANAFWGGKKKPKPVINEAFSINKAFKSSKNTYKLDLNIKIPANSENIIIEQHYDELNDIGLEKLSWKQKDEKKTKREIKAYKVTVKEDKDAESRPSSMKDLGLAYDELTTDHKHMVKSFYFKKDEIFKSDKRERFALGLEWQTGAKNDLALNDHQVYKSEIKKTVTKKPPPQKKASSKDVKKASAKKDEKKAPAPRGGVAGTGMTKGEIVKQQKQYMIDMQDSFEGMGMTENILHGNDPLSNPMMNPMYMQNSGMQQNPMMQNPMLMQQMMMQNPGMQQNPMMMQQMMQQNPMYMQQMNPMMMNPNMMQNPALMQQMMQMQMLQAPGQ